jgi:exodeoxyribonuclease-3
MPLSVATWNVNGLRAREAQLLAWLERDRPDVVCLQEIKAKPEQIPEALLGAAEYWWYWHGAGGYSGVALGVRKTVSPNAPTFAHPGFDHETRIVTTDLQGLRVASTYVPNGGKDYEAKIRFLTALREWAASQRAAGQRVLICGDLNVALTERDVHPKERKPNQIGTRPEERDLLASLIAEGLVDLGRAADPDNDNLFTWWAPWRNLRQRNIGWRIDYILASAAVAGPIPTCRVLAEVGTSDHAPVQAVIEPAVVLGPENESPASA